MSLKIEILSQLDEVIAEGNRLISTFKMTNMYERYSDLPESDFRSMYTRGFAAIERVAGKESEYYRSLTMVEANTHLASPGFHPSPIDALLGSLTALRADVDSGMLKTLEDRLRANVHDDFLQQAAELLKASYHVAAMVLTGGVLENHLQKMAIARNISWTGNGSLAKYNDSLRSTIYPQPTWRRIQSITDLRNHAAHGDTAKVGAADVEDSLLYIQRFLSDYPS